MNQPTPSSKVVFTLVFLKQATLLGPGLRPGPRRLLEYLISRNGPLLQKIIADLSLIPLSKLQASMLRLFFQLVSSNSHPMKRQMGYVTVCTHWSVEELQMDSEIP